VAFYQKRESLLKKQKRKLRKEVKGEGRLAVKSAEWKGRLRKKGQGEKKAEHYGGYKQEGGESSTVKAPCLDWQT